MCGSRVSKLSVAFIYPFIFFCELIKKCISYAKCLFINHQMLVRCLFINHYTIHQSPNISFTNFYTLSRVRSSGVGNWTFADKLPLLIGLYHKRTSCHVFSLGNKNESCFKEYMQRENISLNQGKIQSEERKDSKAVRRGNSMFKIFVEDMKYMWQN